MYVHQCTLFLSYKLFATFVVYNHLHDSTRWSKTHRVTRWTFQLSCSSLTLTLFSNTRLTDNSVRSLTLLQPRRKRRIRNDWDGHWMPGHEFCNICLHSFDYIIKLEEEPLELWYLVDKLGLWSDREVFLNRANSSSRKATEMLEVWDQLRTLDESQREFLDKHFDVDFQMFDYKRRKE